MIFYHILPTFFGGERLKSNVWKGPAIAVMAIGFILVGLTTAKTSISWSYTVLVNIGDISTNKISYNIITWTANARLPSTPWHVASWSLWCDGSQAKPCCPPRLPKAAPGSVSLWASGLFTISMIPGKAPGELTIAGYLLAGYGISPIVHFQFWHFWWSWGLFINCLFQTM